MFDNKSALDGLRSQYEASKRARASDKLIDTKNQIHNKIFLMQLMVEIEKR